MDVNGPWKNADWYWLPRIGYGGRLNHRPSWYSIRWFNLYLSIYP